METLQLRSKAFSPWLFFSFLPVFSETKQSKIRSITWKHLFYFKKKKFNHQASKSYFHFFSKSSTAARKFVIKINFFDFFHIFVQTLTVHKQNLNSPRKCQINRKITKIKHLHNIRSGFSYLFHSYFFSKNFQRSETNTERERERENIREKNQYLLEMSLDMGRDLAEILEGIVAPAALCRAVGIVERRESVHWFLIGARENERESTR